MAVVNLMAIGGRLGKKRLTEHHAKAVAGVELVDGRAGWRNGWVWSWKLAMPSEEISAVRLRLKSMFFHPHFELVEFTNASQPELLDVDPDSLARMREAMRRHSAEGWRK